MGCFLRSTVLTLRSIRDQFVRRNFEGAGRDMDVAIGFLRVERDRAIPALQSPLDAVIEQLGQFRASLEEPTVTVTQLDGTFGRAHWLLAQHYLVLALQARDQARHVNAGHYLWATAHHLERSVLWSGARIDKRVVRALDSIRVMAGKLQAGERPSRVYRDRPIVLTARTLLDIGEHLDRQVRIKDELPADATIPEPES